MLEKKIIESLQRNAETICITINENDYFLLNNPRECFRAIVYNFIEEIKKNYKLKLKIQPPEYIFFIYIPKSSNSFQEYLEKFI